MTLANLMNPESLNVPVIGVPAGPATASAPALPGPAGGRPPGT